MTRVGSQRHKKKNTPIHVKVLDTSLYTREARGSAVRWVTALEAEGPSSVPDDFIVFYIDTVLPAEQCSWDLTNL